MVGRKKARSGKREESYFPRLTSSSSLLKMVKTREEKKEPFSWNDLRVTPLFLSLCTAFEGRWPGEARKERMQVASRWKRMLLLLMMMRERKEAKVSALRSNPWEGSPNLEGCQRKGEIERKKLEGEGEITCGVEEICGSCQRKSNGQ